MADRTIVAVVTGASRGAGRGIARELGTIGATAPWWALATDENVLAKSGQAGGLCGEKRRD